MAHKPICQDIKADQEHVFHYQVDAAEVKHSNSYIRQEQAEASSGSLTVNTEHMPTSSSNRLSDRPLLKPVSTSHAETQDFRVRRTSATP